MTTEELAELFLVHLYDLAEAAPHPNFLFSVNDFVPMYGLSNREELQKAMNLLGDKGLIILAGLDMLGGISAGITVDGSVFVERGGETGVIEKYRENPLSLVASRSELPAPSHVPEERVKAVEKEKQGVLYAGRAVGAILADIEEILEGDDSVAIEARRDLLSDLATIRIQLARSVKNRAVIQAMLDDLSGVPSIAPLVTALNSIFGAYFK